jgi:hypothetical protein
MPFDGAYSGLLPGCQALARRYESIVVANDHFEALIGNLRFAADISPDGSFSAIAMLPSGRGRAGISGKIGVGTMEIDYESPACKSHGRLTAQTFPSTTLPAAVSPASSQAALSSAAEEPPVVAPVRDPSTSVLDGSYSGPVVLSGMPSCGKTIPAKLSAMVKNHNFYATIFNVRFSVELPGDGAFSASGIRHTDRAKAEVNGKISNNSIELDMRNPYCSAHASLTAANDAAVTKPSALIEATQASDVRVAAGAVHTHRRIGDR